MAAFDALMLVSAALWSLTYLLVIRRGFLDGTYGMPLVALCANVSWEFVFSFVHPHGLPQLPANLAWFALDLVILFQLLRYGPKEFPGLPKAAFYAAFVLALGACFSAILLVTRGFGDWDGAYSAFGQNLLMSVLFVVMLYGRGSLRGQSLPIALAKLLGTLFASLAFYLYAPAYAGSVLLPMLFVAILFFDAVYAVAVYAIRRGRGRTRGKGLRNGEDRPLGFPSR